MTIFKDTCPLCNTTGKVWHKKPEVFLCGKCSTLYSKYGLVAEPQSDVPDLWS